LLDAVLDAESSLRSRHLATPPAAEPPHRIAAMAEQIADGAVREGTVHAVDGHEQVTLALAIAGLRRERLYVRDVAAEVAHHAKGMREERFHVSIGLVEARGFVESIRLLAAVETDFIEDVDQF